MIKSVNRISTWRFTLLMITLAWLSSCTSRNNLSDAYGNFEAVQVTVSSESAGKIYFLNVEEGSQPDSGGIVALIDTTDMYLKKLQLQSKKKAIAVKRSTIESQIAVQIQYLFFAAGLVPVPEVP